MAVVVALTYNDFEENTYIIYDETNECIIIDPGCNSIAEKEHLKAFIKSRNLNPVRLINTHCHLDHIFGNKFIYDTYGLLPEIHKGEIPVLKASPQISAMYGVTCDVSPEPIVFIEQGDEISFGNTILKTILTPGHSPASLSFINENDNFVVAGDVLFYESIGRTDLPGGDYDTLINTIHDKLLILPDDMIVYNGHGPATTIGHERMYNPFL
ncbi:MAG TPA: MBL fold metallo-hydrolase, partial [Saprospiraceae bacterium]|nr:MBL fold metallo-hydrolase [Saprospiraceae bacterium]